MVYMTQEQPHSGIPIREVATLAGFHTNTLKRWEQDGLIPAPDRNANGHRRYSPAQVEAVVKVAESKR